MKIWIIIDEQEYGPYAREEVFHFLSAGEVSNETAARIDGSEEVLPLSEALKQSANLFTFDRILVQQEEPTEAAVDFEPENEMASEFQPVAEEEQKSRQLPTRMLAVAALIMVGAAALAWNRDWVWNTAGKQLASLHPQPAQTLATSMVETPARSSTRESDGIPQPLQSELVGKNDPSMVSPTADMEDSDPAPQMAARNDDEKSLLPPASATLAPAGTAIQTVSFTSSTAGRSKPSARTTSNHPETLTEGELISTLAERFASQPVKIFAEEESWAEERKATFRGSFELETSLKWNPKVRVQYRVPQTIQGRPTPSADQMLMLCLWFGAAAPPRARTVEQLLPKLPPGVAKGSKEYARLAAAAEANERKLVESNEGLHGLMRPFSDSLDFTTFSLEIVTDRKDMGNKREAYFYGGSEWVDVVRRAQAEIVKRHHLKAKKLLLYGESLGGTFAARLGVAMADQVSGVVIQNAPEVTLPTAPANTAWLVGVTRGDSGRQGNAELVDQLRKLKTPCVHVINPPAYRLRGVGNLYHSVSPQAFRASLLFFEGIVKLQSPQGENDLRRWLYVRDTQQPLLIKRNDSQAQERIPLERREFLPSREFVHISQTMPISMQFVTLGKDDPKQPLCMVGVPPLGRPKGIIMFSHKYQYRDLPQLLNNLNFMAEQGYLVLAPRLRGSSQTMMQSALSFIKRNQVLTSLPMSFIGVGAENEALLKFLLAQRNFKPAVHVPIDFKPGGLLDEKTWPLGSRFDWPVMFLYEQKDFARAQTPEEAQQLSSDLQEVKAFVDRLRSRSQVADVRFVPAKIKSEEQSAQKEIETALAFIDASAAGKIRGRF